MTLQATPLEGLPLSILLYGGGKLRGVKTTYRTKMDPDAYDIEVHVMLGRLGRGLAGLPRERPNLKKPHATARR